jgi:hypothetical protein
MTEQTPPPGPDESASAAEETTGTGVPGVDAVLSEMDRLDELPLDDHLAAFERAHDALRSALDAVPDAASDGGPHYGRHDGPHDGPQDGPHDGGAPAGDEPA